jgi:hypothetical protein
VFIAGLAIGAQWYRLYLFPFPQIHEWRYPPEVRVPLTEKITITRYTAGTPVFVDRQYYDTVGDERLEGLFLVQIPRHYSENIVVDAHKALTVYRLISEENDNTPFAGWISSDIPVKVRGHTTDHTRVVEKDFPAGTITLDSGGPIASSPILIEVHDYTVPSLEFEVLDQAVSTD